MKLIKEELIDVIETDHVYKVLVKNTRAGLHLLKYGNLLTKNISKNIEIYHSNVANPAVKESALQVIKDELLNSIEKGKSKINDIINSNKADFKVLQSKLVTLDSLKKIGGEISQKDETLNIIKESIKETLKEGETLDKKITDLTNSLSESNIFFSNLTVEMSSINNVIDNVYKLTVDKSKVLLDTMNTIYTNELKQPNKELVKFKDDKNVSKLVYKINICKILNSDLHLEEDSFYKITELTTSKDTPAEVKNIAILVMSSVLERMKLLYDNIDNFIKTHEEAILIEQSVLNANK